jgi:hypothetical protein
MPYLCGVDNSFETAVWGKGRSSWSMQLNAAVAAVKKYLNAATPDHIRDVRYCWVAWRNQQPKEFQAKGSHLQRDFEAELERAYRRHGIKTEPDAPAEHALEIPFAPAVVINRWTDLKRAGKFGLNAASLGVTIAQSATGTGLTTMAEGLILGTTVAVSATGIGLIAAGLALTVASSALSATAAWKSAKHRDNLIDIYDKRDKRPFIEERFCQVIPGPDGVLKSHRDYVQHDMIANQVLPYIIRQKNTKFERKCLGGVPMIGTVESVRAFGRWAYKKYKGTQGATREHAAAWLAAHLITCDCLLVQAIVAELYSPGEMEWLKAQSFDRVIDYLAPKLKST